MDLLISTKLKKQLLKKYGRIKDENILKAIYDERANKINRAIKLTKLMMKINTQIVFILAKYDYDGLYYIGGDRCRATLIKALKEDGFKMAIDKVFFALTDMELKSKKIIASKGTLLKSETIISEIDLVRLANLFNLYRRYHRDIAFCLNPYFRKNAIIYKYVMQLRYDFFDKVRSDLDSINCYSDSIFNKYSFMFYGDENQKILRVKKFTSPIY